MTDLKPFVCDVDGVLAYFVKALLDEIDDPNIKTPEDVTQWNIFGLLSPLARDRALELLTRYDFWRELPVIEGAQEGIAKLKSEGYEIRYATSPWPDCLTWGYARRAWLRFHFKAERSEVATLESKHWIAGAHILDDKADNVRRWVTAWGRPGLLYAQPHNRNDQGGLPCFTWDRYLKQGTGLRAFFSKYRSHYSPLPLDVL